jgi:hypothetical protein
MSVVLALALPVPAAGFVPNVILLWALSTTRDTGEIYRPLGLFLTVLIIAIYAFVVYRVIRFLKRIWRSKAG